MKTFKRIVLGLLAVLLLVSIGFFVWAETPLGPTPEALAALESDSQVTVVANDFIVFAPADKQADTGFVFYPGGRVDYRSYAVPLRAIAEQGYLVVLLRVRLNMAFFDVNAAAPVFEQYPEIQHWAIGGHSLGGVASALFAKELPGLDGIVFWASYPADDALKDSGIKVLSLYGTNDMAGMEPFEESRALLPGNTQFIVIDGGNHAQFGDYGPQPGDKEASISRADQQSQIVEATARFLESLSD
jgi:pimeloyl-ACP methyl ester carboxylesterase